MNRHRKAIASAKPLVDNKKPKRVCTAKNKNYNKGSFF